MSEAAVLQARGGEKRHREAREFVEAQQILADAIFHWRHDPGEDARAAVRFLMRHLATAFRADDAPLQPRPVPADAEEAAPRANS